MGITTQNSVEYAKQVTTPRTKVNAYELGGKVRRYFFTHTQDTQGDANSLVNLCILPAGSYRVVGVYINSSALGAGRTLDVGHTGYIGQDGVAVVADENAFITGLSVSSAVDGFQRSIGADTGVDITSRSEVVVQAIVKVDTLDNAETINGWVEIVIE